MRSKCDGLCVAQEKILYNDIPKAVEMHIPIDRFALIITVT